MSKKGFDFHKLSEQEKGFCLGYHAAMQRSGALMLDVTFGQMTTEYKTRMASLATQTLYVDNLKRDNQK